ncbi:MAG: tetratricopeptide repeat protein [Thermoanaerobaculia bacterium]
MRRAMTTLLAMLSLALVPGSRINADEMPWPTLKAGPHRVGFRTLDVTDYGRTVAPRIDWRGVERPGDNFRQVRISLWYPAVVDEESRPMLYRDTVEAVGFETQMEGELLVGVDAYVAHSTFGGADEATLRKMVEEPTTAFRDAVPLAGQHPVIVYASSFSYEPFENSALFEYLASHGYIIAASRSSGPETREMSADLAGVEASVRDLELILDALHDVGHADLTRVGAAGFSWGALSAVMLGMRNFNAQAVLALDGTFEHAEIPSIEEQYDFRPRRLRGGYLAIVGDREPARSLADDALYTDLFELRYPDLMHWDFASDLIRIQVHSAGEPDAARRALVDEAYGLIAYQARLFFDAYLKGLEVNRQVLLEGNLRAMKPAVVIENLTARAALPPPPSPAEFAMLLRADVEEARQVLDRVKKNDPEIELLDWMQLQDSVSVSPFATKLAILELAKEELGESSILFNNYGQAWRLEGDPEKALGYFRKALAHNPDSGFAKKSIEELEAELADQRKGRWSR